MTTIRITIILLFGLTISSCNQNSPTQDRNVKQDTIVQPANVVDTTTTIIELLNKALTFDTLEFNNQFKVDNNRSFLFFKSGRIINRSDKNAIVIFCPTDTTYTVRLYAIKNNNWVLVDTVSDIEAYPSQFDLTLDDYNFDQQPDIYVNVSASNDWSLSRGHLLIVDPLTNKMRRHEEARDFANMRPDMKTNIIFSETWHGYNLQNQHQLTIYKNKWVNGKLKTVAQKDSIYP